SLSSKQRECLFQYLFEEQEEVAATESSLAETSGKSAASKRPDDPDEVTTLLYDAVLL
ncbi:unnamed protein product, partial [Amoebophrya sp. A25]